MFFLDWDPIGFGNHCGIHSTSDGVQHTINPTSSRVDPTAIPQPYRVPHVICQCQTLIGKCLFMTEIVQSQCILQVLCS